MNKKINIEETIKAILDQEGKQEGTKLIRDILNKIAKSSRVPISKKNHTFVKVAKRVYELMFTNKIIRARAIEIVENEFNISLNTIKNHLTTFDKLAKESNYISIIKHAHEIFSIELKNSTKNKPNINDLNYIGGNGYIYSKNIIHYLPTYAERIERDEDLIIAYYYKYKLDIVKPENRTEIEVVLNNIPYLESEIPF